MPTIHARFQSLARLDAIGRRAWLTFLGSRALGRVGIETNTITKLTSCHLVGGDAVSFASQVPHGHLDTANTAGLSCVVTKLLDLAKDLVYVAGVISEDAALEEEGVGLARTVAHFTKTLKCPDWYRCE